MGDAFCKRGLHNFKLNRLTFCFLWQDSVVVSVQDRDFSINANFNILRGGRIKVARYAQLNANAFHRVTQYFAYRVKVARELVKVCCCGMS